MSTRIWRRSGSTSEGPAGRTGVSSTIVLPPLPADRLSRYAPAALREWRQFGCDRVADKSRPGLGVAAGHKLLNVLYELCREGLEGDRPSLVEFDFRGRPIFESFHTGRVRSGLA